MFIFYELEMLTWGNIICKDRPKGGILTWLTRHFEDDGPQYDTLPSSFYVGQGYGGLC